MAKRIEKVDISDKDVFGGLKSSAESAQKEVFTLSELLEILNKEIKTTAENAKKIKITSAFGSVEDIKAVNVENEKAIKLAKRREELDRVSGLTKKQMQSAEQSLQRQREKGIAQMEREAKRTQEAERPYNKMSATLNKLRKEYKDLAVSGQENTASARKMREEIQRLDKTLKGADASVGQFQRSVGNYPNGFKSAIGALGQLGIAFSGVAIGKDAFNTIRDFDEANADMAKTLGISTEEASKLSMGFTKLGSVTNIKGLQEIATIGGQFGISASEIGGFVSSMDKLNVALGSDFGGVEETAKQLGAMRNIFTDIKTENIDKDLLGIGNALNELSSKGAKVEVVSDFANRISGLAIPLGVTSGEVLGLSATLAKLNVNAERGGTAVGTIFQKMTQDASGFAKVAGVSTEEFTNLLNTDMVGAFKLVAKSFKSMEGDNVKMGSTLESLKLSGSGASEVFLKMASNTELLDENIKLSTDSLKEQDSILQEVEKKSSTVGASVAKLGNAWDNFVLGVNDGTGAQNGIITFFDFLAKNLPTIISTLAKLTAGFVAYKTAVAVANTDFKALISNFTKFKSEAGDGTSKLSGFGNALKGIGWSVAIGLAIELGTKLWDIASGAEQAREDLARLEKQAEIALGQAGKQVDNIMGKYNSNLEILNNQLKAREITEKDYLKLLKEQQTITESMFKSSISSANKRKEDYKEQIAFLEDFKALNGSLLSVDEKDKKIFDEIFKGTGITDYKDFFGNITSDARNDAVAQLEANIGGVNVKLTEYNKNLKEIGSSRRSTIADLKGKDSDVKGLEATTKAIENYTKRVKELNDASIKDEQTRAETQLKTKLQSDLEAIKSNGIMANELRIALEKEFNDAIIQLQKDFNQKREEANQAYLDEIKAQQIKAQEEAEALSQANYDKEIEALNLRDKQIELELINSGKSRDEIDKELHYRKIERLKQEIETAKFYGKETLDLELELANLELQEKEDLAKKEDEIYKDKLAKRKEFVNGVIDEMKRLSDEEIKEIDERLDAEKQFQSELQEQANAGNISAQQSIAESKKLQQEATIEKQKEQKKQQQLDDIKTLYNLINTNIEKGDSVGVASAKAVGSMALIKTIAKMFQGFATGTDWRLGQENKPLFGGVDGHVVRVDSSEGIVRGDLMDKAEKAGITSIDEMVHRATLYGKINPNVYQMNDDRVSYIPVMNENKVDLSPLERRLESLENTIKNKSEFRIDPYILNGVAKGITETEKKGNDIRKRTFKA